MHLVEVSDEGLWTVVAIMDKAGSSVWHQLQDACDRGDFVAEDMLVVNGLFLLLLELPAFQLGHVSKRSDDEREGDRPANSTLRRMNPTSSP